MSVLTGPRFIPLELKPIKPYAVSPGQDLAWNHTLQQQQVHNKYLTEVYIDAYQILRCTCPSWRPKVCSSWSQADPAVHGFPGARHKSFLTEAEAQSWILSTGYSHKTINQTRFWLFQWSFKFIRWISISQKIKGSPWKSPWTSQILCFRFQTLELGIIYSPHSYQSLFFSRSCRRTSAWAINTGIWSHKASWPGVFSHSASPRLLSTQADI